MKQYIITYIPEEGWGDEPVTERTLYPNYIAMQTVLSGGEIISIKEVDE